MKTYTAKIKIYVVSTIILVLVISRFIVTGIYQNIEFTPKHFVRVAKALFYKYQYMSASSLAYSATDLLSSEQTPVGPARSIPVLVYHGIPFSDIPNQFNITLESFKEQMFALKSGGYNTINTDDLYKYLRGEILLPERSVLITFDDGRIDSYEMADPILKALDFKATMFIIGRFSLLGESPKYYLTPEQLVAMDKSGRWDIEAHSYDGHGAYFIAPDVDDGRFFSHKQWLFYDKRMETDEEFLVRITADFEKVKYGLETLLGKQVNSFAFPYGDFGQNTTNYNNAPVANIEASKSLYSLDFYQNAPNVRFTQNYFTPAEASNTFFLIKRINANPEWSGPELIKELENGSLKPLPYIDGFAENNGWLRLWGNAEIGDGKFSLTTKEGESGGTVVLDGTRLWKNYSLSTSVVSPNKNAIYIWVRFQDDDNNAACNFGNGYIHIDQTVDGKKKTIQGVIDKNLIIPDQGVRVEVRVVDRNVECIINDQVVKTPYLDPKLDSGGIGFKTWNVQPDNASLIINSLNIKEL